MKPGLTTSDIRKQAKELRQNQTEPEQRLWARLRSHRLAGIGFRRQHAIGPYIVDFYAPSARLVIEVDGSQHLDQEDYDSERTAYLEQLGLRVIRFWNHQVMNEMDQVLEKILTNLL